MPYSKLSRHVSIGLCASALLAGSMTFAPRVSAADLDMGFGDAPVQMPQQMVTFGSGWYVRGDIAATDTTYRTGPGNAAGQNSFGVLRTKDAGYNLSLGGGYSFTNNFRADIVADFIQPNQNTTANVACRTRVVIATGAPAQNCTLDGSIDRYDALVNGYYDIGTWSIFTPYIGAGAGVAFGNVRTTFYDSQTTTARSFYKGFAWAAMAGVAIDVYPHIKIDVGYRYLDNGTVYGAHLYNHQVRAGIRYMIDN